MFNIIHKQRKLLIKMKQIEVEISAKRRTGLMKYANALLKGFKMDNLKSAYEQLEKAINLPTWGTANWVSPIKTFDPSYGGGDCSLHGRYYGRCYSCESDYDKLQETADNQAKLHRDIQIGVAMIWMKEAIYDL